MADLERFIAELRTRLENDPSDVRSWLHLGDALRKTGDEAGAVKAYKLGAELFEERGLVIRAFAAYKQCLRVDPDAQFAIDKIAELTVKLA